MARSSTNGKRRLAERGIREVREASNLLSWTLQIQAMMDYARYAALDLNAGYAET